MTDVLATAAKHGQVGLRRIHKPDAPLPPWPAHPTTLRALVVRQLLHYERARHRSGCPLDRWTVTDLGKQALEPIEIVKRDTPVYLARGGGQVKYRKLSNGRWAIDGSSDGNGDYTTDASKSIDTDRQPGTRAFVAVEVLVGPAELDVFARKAQEREQDRLREEGDRLDGLAIQYRIELATHTAMHRRVDITSDLRLVRHMAANNRHQHATQKLAEIEATLSLRDAA
jgi:hypothetical protein